MPTYDYQCKYCKHEFEAFQGIKDGSLRKCPKCGRRGLKRLIGAGGGIIFKGTGFYATDYRSGSPDKSAASDPESKSAPSQGSSTSDKSSSESADGLG